MSGGAGIYVGEFKNGLAHGQGIHTLTNGDKYVGKYRNDKRYGQGTLTKSDGQVLEGVWENNKFKYAQKIFPKVYAKKTPKPNVIKKPAEGWSLPPCPGSPESKLTNSRNWTDCIGTHTLDDWEKYVGEWKDGKHHGQGTITFGSKSAWAGDKYVGEFKDNLLHGQGTYTFGSKSKRAGDKYVGEFKDGKQHGQGTYTHAIGNKYVGEWKDGKQHGQGTHTWDNGDKYVGEWKDGKKYGQGTFTFANGGKYVGEWKDGMAHGKGTQTSASGRVLKKGVWENGKFKYAQKVSPKVYAKKTPIPKPSDHNKIVSASSGSGFAVSSDGHVVTNYHVIEGCSDVKIRHKGKEISATVISFDPNNDLALLKGNFRPTTIFPLSRKNPQLLMEIYVAGYPFGRQVSTSVKVTKGIVSSLTGIGNNFSNIQIDAALQPGNSGGPIVNGKGNVVGVAVAKLDLKKVIERFGVIPENINFGIKSSVVRTLLESNNVRLSNPNTRSISTTKLGKMISDATYYLSCWMTMAQIEKMRAKKVIFSNLNQ